ncbi:hypothetical protein C8J56DRAFT_977061 [Mycena floridula]|nr:hypothetical protein C8J56DRAFT_977061 [Mycena floridula]
MSTSLNIQLHLYLLLQTPPSSSVDRLEKTAVKSLRNLSSALPTLLKPERKGIRVLCVTKGEHRLPSISTSFNLYCHSFDRPSTLKKHWLVHTGEKAYQCEICGRRFGVPSNLNRHARKCILKPVNASYRKQVEASRPGTSLAQLPPEDSPVPRARAKPRMTSPTKRRRRAPSPSVWIPSSLRGFNLRPDEFNVCTSVPLAPVCPTMQWPYEERNSWDENFGPEPYHPKEWDRRNRLPGPASATVSFGGKDVRNLHVEAEHYAEMVQY